MKELQALKTVAITNYYNDVYSSTNYEHVPPMVNCENNSAQQET